MGVLRMGLGRDCLEAVDRALIVEDVEVLERIVDCGIEEFSG